MLSTRCSGERGPQRTGSTGHRALHVAASEGHAAVVELLLGAGASLDLTVNGATALWYAAQEGHTGIVQLFLDAGANPEGGRLSGNGTTALHVAARGGYEDVACLLIAAGAPLEAAADDGWTPLHAACAGCSMRLSQHTRIRIAEDGLQLGAVARRFVLQSQPSCGRCWRLGVDPTS